MQLAGSITTKRLNSASGDINQDQKTSIRVKPHQSESKQIKQYQNTIYGKIFIMANKTGFRDRSATHMYLSVMCTCQSGVPISWVYLSVGCTCQSGIPVSRVYLSVGYTCQSGVPVSHFTQVNPSVGCTH